MNSMKLPAILSALVLFALSGCGHIPPNEEICIRLHRGAGCFYTIEDSERRLTEEEWQNIRLGRISMTSDAWIEFRRFIEKVCARKGVCKKKWREIEERLDNVENKIDSYKEGDIL